MTEHLYPNIRQFVTKNLLPDQGCFYPPSMINNIVKQFVNEISNRDRKDTYLCNIVKSYFRLPEGVLNCSNLACALDDSIEELYQDLKLAFKQDLPDVILDDDDDYDSHRDEDNHDYNNDVANNDD